MSATPCPAAPWSSGPRQALGGIDILVNAAGIYQARPFLQHSYEEFDRIQGVNLYGTFNLIQCVIPGMIERAYGKVVNVASTAKGRSRSQAPYNVSKQGSPA